MTSDRRTFLGASLGIATAVASRANGLTTPARAESTDRPSLSCDLGIRAAANLEWFASRFGCWWLRLD